MLQDLGYENLSRESIDMAFSTYQGTVPLYGEISCPGPGSFVGQCVTEAVVFEVDGGEATPVTGLVDADITVFEFLLDG